MKVFLKVLLLIVFMSSIAHAQMQTAPPTPPPPTVPNTSEDETATHRAKSAVSSMVRSHKYKLGIFRILPRLSAHSGYDSDAVFREEEFIGDYYINAEPAASVAVKLGSRAYVELLEQLSFVYYKELDERRDIFNTTHGRFVTGTERLLTTFDAGYYNRNSPVDEEIDIPIEHKVITGGVNVGYDLSYRIDLLGHVNVSQSEYEAQEELNEFLPKPFDRRSLSVGTGINYRLRENLALTGDFTTAYSESLESDRTSSAWSVLGGVGIRRRRLLGNVNLGFGRSGQTGADKRNTFLVNMNLNYQVSRRVTAGLFVGRYQSFSGLVDANVRITTTGGVRSTVRLTSRLSLSGSFSIGQNDFGDELIINGEVVDKDYFQRGQLTLGYRIISNLVVNGGILYLDRNSDIRVLDRDRVAFILGLGYSTTF